MLELQDSISTYRSPIGTHKRFQSTYTKDNNATNTRVGPVTHFKVSSGRKTKLMKILHSYLLQYSAKRRGLLGLTSTPMTDNTITQFFAVDIDSAKINISLEEDIVFLVFLSFEISPGWLIWQKTNICVPYGKTKGIQN